MSRVPPDGQPRRSRAFGLTLEFDFPAPGLPPARDGAHDQREPTRLRLGTPEEIEASWPDEGVEHVFTETFEGDEAPARGIDHAPGRGYRLFARHFGLATISDDGMEVVCAPPELEPWSWQRFLVGRILPWAAVLRGLEAMHASAVTLDGRTLAFVGSSGAGKTSLALRLHLMGAGLLCDDVLALESSPEGVRAHPGASVFCVRDAERDALGTERFARIGELLGHSGKSYVEIRRDEAPGPLSALYFLRRAPDAPDGTIAPLAPEPRLLMSATFNHTVRHPRRLVSMLDVYSRVARDVPVFGVTLTPDLTPEQLAEAVAAHAGGLAPR